jgi:hypothetical protein
VWTNRKRGISLAVFKILVANKTAFGVKRLRTCDGKLKWITGRPSPKLDESPDRFKPESNVVCLAL